LTLAENTVGSGVTAELYVTMHQRISACQIGDQCTSTTQVGLCSAMLHKKRYIDRAAAITTLSDHKKPCLTAY